MTLADWIEETSERFREQPPREAAADSAYRFYVGALRRLSAVYDLGVNVMDREWDVLLVLDACRSDLTRAVADEYEFVSTESVWSVGSSSPEWMWKTFDETYADALAGTAYVTGNPFSTEQVDASFLSHLEEVWQYGWDDDLGTIPPRPLTDAAIRHYRQRSPDRMIVHYMQPHYPFIDNPLAGGMDLSNFGDAGTETAWDRLRKGEVTYEAVWDGYEENLRTVLDDVNLLLESIDAERVVITADHGNSMGEKGLYGHAIGVPVAEQRAVPWCVTSANDTSGYTPETPEREVGADVESRLEDLGYT